MSNTTFHFLARVLIILAVICAMQSVLDGRAVAFFFNVIVIGVLAVTDIALDD